jgi:hypothetical protein
MDIVRCQTCLSLALSSLRQPLSPCSPKGCACLRAAQPEYIVKSEKAGAQAANEAESLKRGILGINSPSANLG